MYQQLDSDQSQLPPTVVTSTKFSVPSSRSDHGTPASLKIFPLRFDPRVCFALINDGSFGVCDSISASADVVVGEADARALDEANQTAPVHDRHFNWFAETDNGLSHSFARLGCRGHVPLVIRRGERFVRFNSAGDDGAQGFLNLLRTSFGPVLMGASDQALRGSTSLAD